MEPIFNEVLHSYAGSSMATRTRFDRLTVRDRSTTVSARILLYWQAGRCEWPTIKDGGETGQRLTDEGKAGR